MTSELKDCQARLESLQKKSQEKHLVVWSVLNPNLTQWNEVALGFSDSFKMVEKYERLKDGSPEAFLYSNSIQSCLDFSKKYSMEIKKQETFAAMGAFFLVFVAAAFIYYGLKKRGVA